MTDSRNVLVTGGNTGIGAAVSRQLAAEGYNVAIGYLTDAEGAERLATELTNRESRCVAVRCDVTDAELLAETFRTIRAEIGAVSRLVNNAAISGRTPILEMSQAEWDGVIDVNLSGTFRCIRLAVPDMIAQGGGAIVNIASELALIGGVDRAHYIASKAGIIGLTRALAFELGPQNIRVNAVAPGATDTGMLRPDERSPEYLAGVPLRRLGKPVDIARSVAFLCGDGGDWYTGQVLSPNGGVAF